MPKFSFILHRDLFFKRRKTNRYTGPTGRYTGLTGRFTGSSCPSHIAGIPAKPASKSARPVYRSVPFERQDLNSNKFKRGFVRFRPVTGLTGPVNRYRSPAVRPVRSGMETLGGTWLKAAPGPRGSSVCSRCLAAGVATVESTFKRFYVRWEGRWPFCLCRSNLVNHLASSA